MHTKTELLTLLRERGIRLMKRLGQHYLVDPNTCRKLVSLCDLSPQDTVIEIGAGLGALTDLLAVRCKQVIAIEVDREVSETLRQRMAHLSNVEVRCQDILEFPWADHRGCQVVGAIPYHITSPILANLCDHASDLAGAWLGMQQEVARRLTAQPGSKTYGRLTILMQYRFAVTTVSQISRSAFFPQPDVDSTWLRLEPHPRPPVTVKDETLFFEVVRSAFGQRRKTLANCLVSLVGTGSSLVPRDSLADARSHALAALQAAGVPPRARGEELSLAQFAALANHLYTTQ